MAWNGEAKKVRAKTLAAVDRRCAAGGMATVTQLRSALSLRFQYGQRSTYDAWASATGAPSFMKLNAAEGWDALYCLTWCSAWGKTAAEYCAITCGAAEEAELELMAA